MTGFEGIRSSPQVRVVVLNWNGRAFLGPCLAALARQTYPAFRVTVVDNGSTDGSVELIRTQFPDADVIVNPRNLGFATANNQAIRASSEPFVATLNNDTEVEPDWLQELVRSAQSDPSVGAVASKMVFHADPEIINSCGIALDRAGIAWDAWGGRPAALVDHSHEVFGACAGAALYRRTMLDQIGPFDEDFFAYLEDVDLAWRARVAGWRAVLAPRAVVRHVHSGTLGDASPRKRFLLGRNKLWMIAKGLPDRDLWQLPLIMAYELGAIGMRLAEGDWAAIQGRIAGFLGLPRMLGKRAEVHRAGARSGAVRYDPLVWPWQVRDRFQHLRMAQSAADETAASSREISADPVGAPATPVIHRVRDVALRGVGSLLSRTRGSSLGPSGYRKIRILVLRPDHLGDVLLSRPAIELLRASLPEAELTVVVGPWGAPSLQGMDCRIVTFPFPGFQRARKANLLAPYAAAGSFAGRLAREGFDAVVMLRPDHWWGSLAASLASIPIRVGMDVPSQRPFLTHRVGPVEKEPVSESALRLARSLVEALGGVPVDGPAQPRFAPSTAARGWARDWLTEHARAGARLALHPGSGGAAKQWPAHRWGRVIRDVQDQGHTVVLTTGAAERTLAREIAQHVPGALPMVVEASWDQLAGIYESVELVVGMDSGPLHLAAAVGTPTVRLYGPVDPAIYGPPPDDVDHRVFAGGTRCAPCGYLESPPCGYLSSAPCLAVIPVDEVTRAVLAALAETGSHG